MSAAVGTLAPAPAPPSRLRGNLVAVASLFAWATAFPATDILLRTWAPLPLAAVRLALAASALATILLVTGRGRELAVVPWGQALLVGGLGIAGSVSLLISGQAAAGAVTAAIVTGMLPVFATLIGLAHGERPTALLLLAIAVSIAGGAVAALRPGVDGGFGLGAGELMLAGSGFAWAWVSRELPRRLAGVSDVARSCAGLACGALCLALVAAVGLATGLVPPRWTLDAASLPLLLWMGIVGVGFSFPLWLAAVRELGLPVASLHNNLAPFYVMLLAALAGSAVEGRQVLGGILVAAGALLAQLPGRGAKAGSGGSN